MNRIFKEPLEEYSRSSPLSDRKGILKDVRAFLTSNPKGFASAEIAVAIASDITKDVDDRLQL